MPDECSCDVMLLPGSIRPDRNGREHSRHHSRPVNPLPQRIIIIIIRIEMILVVIVRFAMPRLSGPAVWYSRTGNIRRRSIFGAVLMDFLPPIKITKKETIASHSVAEVSYAVIAAATRSVSFRGIRRRG